ncbi:hypothetical protein PPTG_01876 [Phytophthora nicotianae INRA-310]|uniref:Uncharacterized protein n=1 Tax=Phytophthora nicotianae (strain INRA-310) TaxID=761204 RepID=W2R993_PHYN3|nr:hypothetical protein PPTG_01876 [Phytophthora nicotianae INRA-310]ETN21781.1 hypothetical protein PPTG_01876 [Phytophthora nicotianae INRA-310]
MPKVVCDLLWTVTSPHLLSDDRFPVLPAEFGVEALKFDVVIDWLNALVQDPTPLLTFLQETTSNGRSLALVALYTSQSGNQRTNKSWSSVWPPRNPKVSANCSVLPGKSVCMAV